MVFNEKEKNNIEIEINKTNLSTDLKEKVIQLVNNFSEKNSNTVNTQLTLQQQITVKELIDDDSLLKSILDDIKYEGPVNDGVLFALKMVLLSYMSSNHAEEMYRYLCDIDKPGRKRSQAFWFCYKLMYIKNLRTITEGVKENGTTTSANTYYLYKNNGVNVTLDKDTSKNISDLDINATTKNALSRAGCKTANDIKALINAYPGKWQDHIRYIGVKGAKDVEAAIK